MIDELHDVLKKRLDDLFEDTMYKSPKKDAEPILRQIKSYTQYFPKSSFETDEEEFPYLLLRTNEGKVPKAESDEPINMKVMIIVGIFDDNMNNQGYRDVLSIIGKITSDLAQKPVMGKFELAGPMDWVANDEDIHPYFIGVIETNWGFRNVELQSNQYV